jgi:hypothetical protein
MVQAPPTLMVCASISGVAGVVPTAAVASFFSSM